MMASTGAGRGPAWIARPAGQAGDTRRALVWLCLLVAASLALTLVVPPTGDLPWRLHVAREMLAGREIYVDVIETNPPLWFWAAAPAVWAERVSGLPAYALLCGWIHLLALGVVALWDACTRELLPRAQRFGGWLLVAAAMLLTPLAETGQREQAALVAALLWAGLLAARIEGRTVPVWAVAGVAVLSAYGFAMKHWFVLLPVAGELALAWRARRAWRPVRPETVILGVAALAYALAVVLAAPEFLQRIVPLVDASYWAFGGVGRIGPLAMAGIIAMKLSPLLLVAGLFIVVQEKRTLSLLLLGAALLFALAAVMQFKGWRYHLIAAQGAGFLAMGLAALAIGAARTRRVALGVACCFLALFSAPAAFEAIRDGGRSVDPALRELVRAEPDGARVLVLDVAPEHAFILMVQERREHLSRHYSLWMMPGLAVPSDDPRREAVRRSERARVLAEFRADMRCRPSDLVIAHQPALLSPRGGQPVMLDLMGALLEDPDFLGWFDRTYQRVAGEAYGVWRLRGERPDDTACARRPAPSGLAPVPGQTSPAR